MSKGHNDGEVRCCRCGKSRCHLIAEVYRDYVCVLQMQLLFGMIETIRDNVDVLKVIVKREMFLSSLNFVLNN